LKKLPKATMPKMRMLHLSSFGLGSWLPATSASRIWSGFVSVVLGIIFFPRDFRNWLIMLCQTFGTQFIVALFFIQHVCKGFMFGSGTQGLVGAPMMFLFRELRLPAPRMQILTAVAATPWSIKPLIGLISDLFSIFGFHKGPFMILATMLACLSFIAVGFLWPLHELLLTLLFFLMMLQVTVTDLLSEAKYAEKLKQHPAQGPALMSFVWGGIFFWQTAGTICVGVIMSVLGIHYVYIFCLVPGLSLFLPLALNWIGEVRKSTAARACVAIDRSKLAKEWKLFLMSLIMSCAALGNAVLGVFGLHSIYSAIGALCSSVVVLVAFAFLTPRTIAKVNTYFFLNHMSIISIETASFYFFTDTPSQYPEGPHFSVFFYTTIIGVVGAVFSFLGTFPYQRWMKNWHYKTVFVSTSILFMLVNLLNVIVYKRWNLVIGIPDQFFVLGADAAQQLVMTWTWIPGLVMISQLCPDGVEATMYALLAGSGNLGGSLARYLGAFILELLSIAPRGNNGESDQFNNLWIAAILSAVLPLLPLLLIRWLIPDARQTDKITLDENGDYVSTETLSITTPQDSSLSIGEPREDGPHAESSTEGDETENFETKGPNNL